MKKDCCTRSRLVLMVFGVACVCSGCASVSTPMRHADGRVMNCSAAGFGLIGTPAALIMRDNCVSSARNNGFVAYDEQLSSSQQNGAAGSSNSSYKGKVAIALPDGWARKPAPTSYINVVDYATNDTLGAFMLLSHMPRKNVTDIAQFAETKRATQISKLRDASSTEMLKSSLSGRSSLSTIVDGVFPGDGARYSFKQVVIDSEPDIILLSVWTSAANYAGPAKEQIDAIEKGIGGL